MKKLFILLSVLTLFISSCTKNERARNFGGQETINIVDRKLVNVTWKQDDLWILTREMDSTDKVKSYKFEENSSYGIFEGTININEIRSKDMNLSNVKSGIQKDSSDFSVKDVAHDLKNTFNTQ